ncbi:MULTISPECIES: SGNH/GDSL hydrolase family protein [unclassified Methylobacter]|uniref:SGNH/GDSL hydrolase family protein n=1 Tax=unclassified Methylobacter TaxID=2635283 RepID=UPI001895531E|nr:SGNH/GDSL hydrolase family protein [Methylobacter sp. BlB1]MBF6649621.1 SGNH/GDSL hydrolase family protein [Methylobacter sp. BlB1]
MKTILCYGDSNTWGYIPGTGQRYAPEIRWPGILSRELGNDYRVVEEGLSGRYTVWDEPFRPGRNGAALLLPLLQSHAPLDLVILMLGTNDVLHFRDNTAFDAARGAGILIDIVQKSSCGPDDLPPDVLLVSPPRITQLSAELGLKCHGLPERSAEFEQHYAAVASAAGCYFIDAADYCEPSPVDGVHLDEAGHLALGMAMAAKVQACI